ncbi:hypothetical protein LCGC14_2503610 [marine sediment metagenome]|uniref:Uncharacterized protein n=1 Tax=marine sediment metagenome TaxID=412755 RepID=A0A0F9BP47_9ZZZZ
MNFEECCKERLKQGQKEHGNKWNNWTGKIFMDEIQEELVDAVNYFKKMQQASNGHIITLRIKSLCNQLEIIYNELELWKEINKK